MPIQLPPLDPELLRPEAPSLGRRVAGAFGRELVTLAGTMVRGLARLLSRVLFWPMALIVAGGVVGGIICGAHGMWGDAALLVANGIGVWVLWVWLTRLGEG